MKERAAMRKLFKAMVPSDSINNTYFKILAKEHNFGGKDILTVQVANVLAAPSLNVRRDQNNGHMENCEIRLNDLKDVVKVSEDEMMPGAHEHMFCSALLFACRYKYIELRKDNTRY